MLAVATREAGRRLSERARPDNGSRSNGGRPITMAKLQPLIAHRWLAGWLARWIVSLSALEFTSQLVD